MARPASGEVLDWRTYPGLNGIAKYALKYVENAYSYETYSAIREIEEEQKRAKEEKGMQMSGGAGQKNEHFARD